MKTRALVVGSVAFDIIFDIHGRIQDEILIKNGKLGRQNLMFTAKSRKRYFGGTGANVAYGLGLLGVCPMLFSLAGEDFMGEFENHLKKADVDSRVAIKEGQWTATFYGMSDEETQQIGVYQPNAYEGIDGLSLSETLSGEDFKQIGAAIFSAGTGQSIYRQMKELRDKLGKAVLIIFDPGQVISVFYDKKLLEKTLRLADIFIGNEVELKQLEQILGYSRRDLFRHGVRFVIETFGERGSAIYEDGKKAFIPAVKAKKIVETTGAGDAYRAGLIFGLLKGISLEAACLLGAKVAARSVEYPGAETYRLSRRDLEL